MTNKTVKINGLSFPMEDVQDKHTNASITGKTFVAVFGMTMDEVPAEKKTKWSEKGYGNINNMAYGRSLEQGTRFGEQFPKTLWWILQNRPANIIIYCTHVADYIMGIIKFCLTHNITVCIEDLRSGIKAIYPPAGNVYTMDLFKKFKVETIDTKVLIADLESDNHETVKYTKRLLNQIWHKRQILAEARRQHMRPIWETVNIYLEELTDFYTDLRREEAIEKRIKADRYVTQDILLSASAPTYNEAKNFYAREYGVDLPVEPEAIANISFFVYNEYNGATGTSELDKPEILDIIMNELSIWAPAFEIDIKLRDRQPDPMTYSTRLELVPSKLARHTDKAIKTSDIESVRRKWKDPSMMPATEAKGTATKEILNSVSFAKKMNRIKDSLKRDDLHKLVQAYLQIQEYKKDIPAFLSDMYYICECGAPVSKKAQNCRYCGTRNPETMVKVRISEAQYKKLKKLGLPLDVLELKYNCEIYSNAIIFYLDSEEDYDQMSFEFLESFTDFSREDI